MDIINIAIIAHVDHGKTTLVDAMLKQTNTFRANQKEMGQELIMDSNDLEREKGITILAKNTSVFYHSTSSEQVKINIVDTPGHADFGGEVERILNMVSGAILLVDASEGPLPQTTFVLKKALAANLKIIVVVNKIDRPDSRIGEVLREIENLFLEFAHHESHLTFPTLYAVGRDGKAFLTLPEKYDSNVPGNLTPLFETILKEVPQSSINSDKPFQMMVSNIDYDSYVGRLAIGRITSGTLKKGQSIVCAESVNETNATSKIIGTYRAEKLYTSVGLERKEVEVLEAGDIVAISGIPDISIGQTICDPTRVVALPKIEIEEPMIKITIGANTSPLSGRDGTFFSAAQISDRLMREKQSNYGMRIEQDSGGSQFTVAGRGELHLAILIETMRREGFELQVSKPEVIEKTIEGVICEPFEEVTIDVATEHVGVITQELSQRGAQLIDMKPVGEVGTRFVYTISSNNLLGLRNALLTKTRGTALISSLFTGYFPKGALIESRRNGALIAIEAGKSLSYGLENAQDRGSLFIGPGEQVYEGMVVGISSRDSAIEINVCKAKKQTNVRSENADIAIALVPPIRLTLEAALDFIGEDELLEVTPQSLRIRKKILSSTLRRIAERKK